VPEAPIHGIEPSDQELVEACLLENSAAWEALIRRYERLIYSVPIRLGMSPEEAVDIFQSVCFILFKKLATLRDHERLYSWLITTTTRECWRTGAQKRRDSERIQSNGRNGPIPPHETISAEQLAYERRLAEEQHEVLRRAMSQLPDRCRELLTMLYFLSDEPTYEDVARCLNIPISSIGPTRSRCLAKLKRILQGSF
jgi:RNA polymerase sigma factor (sigma-70 family)